MKVDPRHSTLLSAALLLRGDVTVSDAQRNLARLRPSIRLPPWNPDGVKIGLCSTPTLGQPLSMLALTNSCCMAEVFGTLTGRFDRLYKRKAHVHHYTQFMEAEALAQARESLATVQAEYARLGAAVPSAEALDLLERLRGAPTT